MYFLFFLSGCVNHLYHIGNEIADPSSNLDKSPFWYIVILGRVFTISIYYLFPQGKS